MALVPCPCSRALLAASPANDRTPDHRFGPGRPGLELGEWPAKDAMRLRGVRPAGSAGCGGVSRALLAAMGAGALLQRRWAGTGAIHPRRAPRQCQSRRLCPDSSCGLPVSCLSSRCFKALPLNARSIPSAVFFYNHAFLSVTDTGLDRAGHAVTCRELPALASTRSVELHGAVAPSHRDGLAWAEAAFQQGGGERVL